MENRGNKGHSTKAKGIDKRKNQYKDILDDALTTDDLTKVVKMLHNKAIKDEDVNAAKILMEYYLGKPTQTIEQKNTHTLNDFSIKSLYDTKAQK
jgi:tagatose-1,6-bisphosphate aldolase